MPYNNFGQPQIPDMLTPMMNAQKSQGNSMSSMLGLAGGLMGGYANQNGGLGSLFGMGSADTAAKAGTDALASTPLNMTIAGKTVASPGAMSASPSLSGFGSYAMSKLQDPAMKAQLMKMFGGM